MVGTCVILQIFALKRCRNVIKYNLFKFVFSRSRHTGIVFQLRCKMNLFEINWNSVHFFAWPCRSWGSVVSIMTSGRTIRLRISAGGKIFLFSNTFAPALGTTQPPIQKYWWIASEFKAAGAWSTTYLPAVPKLRIIESLPPLHLPYVTSCDHVV